MKNPAQETFSQIRRIDFHAHLGDIFHTNRNVTFKQNIIRRDFSNPYRRFEESGFSEGLKPEEAADMAIANLNLCRENTLENLTRSLDDYRIDRICLYPILPNTSFEEYLAASKLENRIIPFTSADFSLPLPQLQKKLRDDIAKGAKGLKIHPVLQNISLTDERVHAAVEVFGEAGLPVVSHCGAYCYYADETNDLTDPAAADAGHFAELANEYPQVTMVAGHAGGFVFGGEMEKLARGIKGLSNVYVDTSFRGADDIAKMIGLFGADKVLFGTDLPFTTYKGAIPQVIEACQGDSELEEKIFCGNAARILHLAE